MNQLKAGVVRRFDPRSFLERPVSLGGMCVEAVLEARTISVGPQVPEPLFFGYEGV
jgi:hypothetical protein